MPHRTLIRLGMSPALARSICAFGGFVFPVSVGTTAGAALVDLHDFGHPYVIFVLASAAIQLFIALLRSWFKERSELVATLAAQIDKQEGRFLRRNAEETLMRHELANQVQNMGWQLYCVLNDKPMVNPPKPLYDVEAERATLSILESGEIHISRHPAHTPQE